MDNFLSRFENTFDELTLRVNDLATSCFSHKDSDSNKGRRSDYSNDRDIYNNHNNDNNDDYNYNNNCHREKNNTTTMSDDPILELAENTNKVFDPPQKIDKRVTRFLSDDEIREIAEELKKNV